jgi:putative ABC transport system substrate-binding protein
MRRRDFVVAAGGVVLVAGSAAAAARQVAPALPVVAFLHSGSSQTNKGIVAAFGLGLQQNGYQDGKNIRIEYRWAEDRPDQIKALAAELLRRPVAAVAANSIAALSVKSLTTTVPIVFQSGIDPVAAGLVASLGHPGGNATGVSFFASTMEAKKLELLRQLMPQSAPVAVLVNPGNPQADTQINDVQTASAILGQPLIVVKASNERDLDEAFGALVQRGAKALVTVGDAFLNSQRGQLIALAARGGIPVIYSNRENVDDGGLISYGASLTEAYRQVGVYVGRVLKGAKPADLPVVQPTKFEMIINLKTARALGLNLPSALLERADALVE